MGRITEFKSYRTLAVMPAAILMPAVTLISEPLPHACLFRVRRRAQLESSGLPWSGYRYFGLPIELKGLEWRECLYLHAGQKFLDYVK